MNEHILVNSRCRGPDGDDYSWREWRAGGWVTADTAWPALLAEFGVAGEFSVDSFDKGVVAALSAERVLVSAVALPSGARDFSGRRIRVSAAWVFDDADAEAVDRAGALYGRLKLDFASPGELASAFDHAGWDDYSADFARLVKLAAEASASPGHGWPSGTPPGPGRWYYFTGQGRDEMRSSAACDDVPPPPSTGKQKALGVALAGAIVLGVTIHLLDKSRSNPPGSKPGSNEAGPPTPSTRPDRGTTPSSSGRR